MRTPWAPCLGLLGGLSAALLLKQRERILCQLWGPRCPTVAPAEGEPLPASPASHRCHWWSRRALARRSIPRILVPFSPRLSGSTGPLFIRAPSGALGAPDSRLTSPQLSTPATTPFPENFPFWAGKEHRGTSGSLSGGRKPPRAEQRERAGCRADADLAGGADRAGPGDNPARAICRMNPFLRKRRPASSKPHRWQRGQKLPEGALPSRGPASGLLPSPPHAAGLFPHVSRGTRTRTSIAPPAARVWGA